ncbi:MAG TPA: hypothetical protein DIC64_04890 [Alphaproteobacteria bacterium]|nr:hypothetical protein [Alphaproteobacteria bacterium]
MQKNNVKSFICSFLFSILAVFAVQKVFLHTPQAEEKPTPHIKPQKISLFSENKSFDEKSLSLASGAAVDVSQIGELTAPAKIEIAQADLPAPSADNTLIYNIPHNPLSVQTDLAHASEIKLSNDELSEIHENKEHIESGIVYADISDTFEQSGNQISLAQNDTDEIPLFEGVETLHQHINVANSSSASQIAMVEPSALINTIEEPDILEEEKNLAEADIKKSELGDMFAISQNSDEIDESAWSVASAASENESVSEEQISLSDQDSPWVMAKGNKFAKNQAAVETFSSSIDEQTDQENEAQDVAVSQKEEKVEKAFSEPLLKKKETDTKLAYQMIQNILIPIPDDILNDADLTPDLTASPEGGEQDPKSIQKSKMETPDLNENEKQSGLLKSISTWFGKNKNDETDKSAASSADKNSQKTKDGIINAVKGKVFSALGSFDDYQKTGNTNIMPAELRLSFQPNRAEISGQTLRWIYAFADNARDNDDVYVEVRIDGTSSYALQQKRLNLLSSIFASRGVDYRKINTIFTSREPNSFIIRNIRFNNKSKGDANK